MESIADICNKNTNRPLVFHRLDGKHCCLILLLVSSILFTICVTDVHFVHQVNINRSSESELYSQSNRQQSSTLVESYSKTRNAVDIIRDILAAEYDQQDLLNFYSLVEKNLAIGVRCATAKSDIKVNLTNVLSNNKNSMISPRNSSLSTAVPDNNSNIIRRPHRRQQLYSFMLNNSGDLCSEEPLDLIIMIISKPDNYKTRDAIRRTWGSGKSLGSYLSIRFKVLFLLDFDQILENSIRLEQNLFRDIVQVELLQQYTLVTHRVLSLFEWSFRFCRSAKFVFKTDDDVFINIILLLKFLTSILSKPTDTSFRPSELKIYGNVFYHSGVFRDANDPILARYVVTSEEFPCENYPDFLCGSGYLIPRKARDALIYTAYQDINPFRISDVYMTGILFEYLSIKRQPMASYQLSATGNCDTFFGKEENAFACVSGQHFGDSSDVFINYNRYWKRIRKV